MPRNFRFSLSRALQHAEDRNAPEFEEIYQLENDEADWRQAEGLSNEFRSKPGQGQLRIPWDRLATRDLLAAGTGSQGNYAIGLDVPLIQQSLRPTSLAMKLPITVLEGLKGNVALPRISTGVTSSNLTEIAALSTADPSFGAASGGPYRLTAQIICSKQLLHQAAGGNVSFDNFLAKEIRRSISHQLDLQLMAGTGINAQVIGLLNQPGLNSFTFGGAATFTSVLSMVNQLETAFVDAEGNDNARWLVGPGTAKKWRALLRGSGSVPVMMDGEIADIPAYTSTLVGSSEQVVLADWSQLIVGFWGGGIDLVVDKYSKAGTGEVILVSSCYWDFWTLRPTVFIVSPDGGNQ